MKMKSKKGSHVGVVLSFVIFITFIVFIYVIIQPAIKLGDKQNSLESLERELVENSSSNFTRVSLSITKLNPLECVELLGFFTKTEIGNHLVVRSDAGSLLQAKISDDGTDLLVVRGGNTFFRTLEAEEFDAEETGTITPCQPLSEGTDYNIGSMKTDQRVFETKIIKLINDYNTDYENLKKELKVAAGEEFEIGFTYGNGTTVTAQNQDSALPSSLNVYASNAPILYINKDAGTETGYLNIKVW